MKIFCCQCNEDVNARLTDGGEVYPHRADLIKLPFWICDSCGNYVGCHHKTNNPTKPLGVIPSKEIKIMRQLIHKMLDEIWKDGYMSRSTCYSALSKSLGFKYHTASLKSIDECNVVIGEIRTLRSRVGLPV